jgi:uracil-xanthine permease
MPNAVDPLDEILPARRLIAFGLQHVLVMAASPITAAFLVAQALNLSDDLKINLISATFLVSGLGTLLQSFGPAIFGVGFGARLPFVMLPGGAPVVIFLTIARQTDLRTAVGAVILTGFFYFALLPIFARCLKFFPRIVIGTMLLLVAINLVGLYGGIITGRPGTPGFADPANIGLALATILFTVLFVRVLPGMFGQLAVLLGLLAGAALAAGLGLMHLDAVLPGPILSLPTLFPFGWPRFDLVATLPLLIFSAISMAEATSQTVAVGEIVGRGGAARADVPRTIRGDALMSLVGGCLGTSLIITSGENIGIIRATGVRSRYVTATAGVLLLAASVFAPFGRLANAIPGPVVGGTALIVFAIIGTMGIDMLRRVDLHAPGQMFTLAASLAIGLLPILVPGLYSRFPATAQIILSNGLAMGTMTAVLCNLLFGEAGARPSRPELAALDASHAD